MIRTDSVSLTTMPGAIAYRRKLPSGGSAIVIICAGKPQPGIATISKSSGEPIIAANSPKGVYSVDAFKEAMTLTAGMPYRKQGKPTTAEVAEEPIELPDEEGAVTEEQAEVVIDADEYQKLVDTYTDKNGKLSYDLMNKEMIQFAHKSEVVAQMIGAGESEDAILAYIVGTKFRNATGNKNLTDEQVAVMAQLIDDVSPIGAFKELKAKIRSMQADAKR